MEAHILDNSPLSDALQIFSSILPFCNLSSHFLDIVFCRAKVLNFNEVQLINYFLHESGL